MITECNLYLMTGSVSLSHGIPFAIEFAATGTSQISPYRRSSSQKIARYFLDFASRSCGKLHHRAAIPLIGMQPKSHDNELPTSAPRASSICRHHEHQGWLTVRPVTSREANRIQFPCAERFFRPNLETSFQNLPPKFPTSSL
jgi:hypothetical protein